MDNLCIHLSQGKLPGIALYAKWQYVDLEASELKRNLDSNVSVILA